MPNGCSLHAKPLRTTDNAVSHSFIQSFNLLDLWAVSLSTANSVSIKSKINILSMLSYPFQHYMFTISCVFLSEYNNSFFCTLYLLQLSVSFYSSALKINKVQAFLQMQELLKSQLFFSFPVLCFNTNFLRSNCLHSERWRHIWI